MNIPLLSNETITPEQLNNALVFNIYRHAGNRNNLTKKINNLFSKLSLTSKHKSKAKDALRQIILNLFIGYLGHTVIKYSRNRDKYHYKNRYGKLYFKYKTVILLIDTLECLGYLEQRIGFFNKDKGRGKESRMWPTEKLINFLDISFNDRIVKEQPKEIIHLKNEKKLHINYNETQHTDRLRKRLEKYNYYISKQNIILKLENETFNIEFLHTLWNWIISGMIEVLEIKNFAKKNSIEFEEGDVKSKEEDIINVIEQQVREEEELPVTKYFLSDTGYILRKSLLKNIHLKHINWKEKAIFEVDKLVIKLSYEFLHKVFNNSKFFLGGRTYGAVHQGLPSKYRKHILINNNPTIELDYSSLHIRMLYHLENVDYTRDPYKGLQGNRDRFKAAQLVLINAESREEAIKGIRKALLKKGFKTELKNEDINKLIDCFVALHPKIKIYMCSDIGLELQNIDSRIMDNILTNLTKMGIPALPVHDSVIVEKGYEEELKYQMVNCYKKEMNGFEPIIH